VYATIGGGFDNRIQINASAATIGGGYFNTIQTNATSSTIAGGQENVIGLDSVNSTIGGGFSNIIRDESGRCTIAGGEGNEIGTNSSYGAIGGGSGNAIAANSPFATVPGGELNVATNWAFAAGRYAKAVHTGAFVWADSGLSDIAPIDIASTNDNSVTIRASGGYRLFTDTDATTGAFLAAGSGSWTSMSDRNAKENFGAADGSEVLQKVVALPVQTWNYKSQAAGIRHIGPMAQDFQAAFGVGESDTGIATVDADGVALAAIQGLNEKVEVSGQRSKARIQKLEAENSELKQRLADLERAVQKLGILETQP